MKKRVLFFIPIVCWLAACNNQQETSKLPADIVRIDASADESAKPSGEKPILTFLENTHSFGKIKEGEQVTYSFKFKNTGKADLLIATATASCGCTVPEYPKDLIKPNEEASIQVKFDSKGKSGVFEKTVTVIANTEPRENLITITGEIITP